VVALLLWGCPTDPSEPPPQDDDDTVVQDDDDLTPTSDDDDSAAPSMTFDPFEVAAGEVLDVEVEITNFDVSTGTYICCDYPDVRYWRTVVNEDGLVIFRFFFGLFGEGEMSWGLDNQEEVVVGWFDVAPYTEPIPAVVPGQPAAQGDIGELRGFDLYSFEVEQAGSMVHVRASNPSTEAFRPWLLLLDDDGRRALDIRGTRNEDGTFEEPLVAFRAEWPGTWYLRVQDFHLDMGTYDLDFSIVGPRPPAPLEEVEPNDLPADWQDLGRFDGGVWELTGVSATAGHGPDSELDGDLDLFRFELDHDSIVHLELWWSSSDDLDALVYDASEGDPILGWDQAIDGQMATGALPQEGDYELSGGVPYVLEVGNYEGDPDVPWSMTIDVVPRHFPGDPVEGDDDDSAGDDDDSAGDDDDSAVDDDDSAR